MRQWGYQVVGVDNDPRRNPDICSDILEWDYKSAFQPGHFAIITASPPCTEFSAAKTIGTRDLETAWKIVNRTLEIIEYLAPPIWWLETPQYGILGRSDQMKEYARVDVDYCQFEETGYEKPTRFFGSAHLDALPSVKCDQRTCSSLLPEPAGAPNAHRKHRRSMGGSTGCAHKETAYHIPEGVIEYVTGFVRTPPSRNETESAGPTPGLDAEGASEVSTVEDGPTPGEGTPPLVGEEDEEMDEDTLRYLAEQALADPEDKLARQWAKQEWRVMRLRAESGVAFEDEVEAQYEEIAEELLKHIKPDPRVYGPNAKVSAVKTGPETCEKVETDLAKTLREKLLEEFGKTSLSGIYQRDPPTRGPYGEAEIWLKPDAKPVSRPPFRMYGERFEALDKLVREAQEAGKLESGVGSWNTPVFPIPKKTPGQYRLVQDLRPQNEATLKDGHPLPRIGDIVQRQGKYRVWTTMDLVDGFHQMPMKREHRPITCMSTPSGVKQWTVLVMGLKNAGSQFQRMMEWVLADHPHADPYIDDVIIGGEGETEEEALWGCFEAVRKVLKHFEELNLVCHPAKSEFFQKEIQFCGHILREGRRSPAPGKMLPLQTWPQPQTITELRAFLGLANYFSEYVHHYAEAAAPLMGKLKVNRIDGKKGSKVRLVWTKEETEAFEKLKRRMCEQMELWQLDVDKPYKLCCDASDYAVGAELQQEVDGKWRPVALFSRKLGGSQLKWSVREKETYAVVAALRKWAGVIGFQPLEVTTDHRALIDWVTEHVDTPSGPRGRRARWHETFSQFDMSVKYVPGEENIIPDALSRLHWTYPADSAREDVTTHGSLVAREEVKAIEAEEKALLKRGIFCIIRKGAGSRVQAVETRGGAKSRPREVTDEPRGEAPEEGPRTRSKTAVPSPKLPAALPGGASSSSALRKTPDDSAVPKPLGFYYAKSKRPAGTQGEKGKEVVPREEPQAEEAESRRKEPVVAKPLAVRLPPVDTSEESSEETSDSDSEVESLPLTPMAKPAATLPTDGPRFQHAPVPPYGGDRGTASRRPGKGKRPRSVTGPRLLPWEEPNMAVLKGDWTGEYQSCTTYGPVQKAIEEATHDTTKPWPPGYKVLNKRLYLGEKLCVPRAKFWPILKAHHVWFAHQGQDKFLKELDTHYHFPAEIDLKRSVREVQKTCLTCQACRPPRKTPEVPIAMTVIPPRFMSSVAVDVFSMKEVEYRGETYDAFLLCVDRHSGWIIARPTTKEGLTAEVAANLLLDTTWGEVAVPSVVTSDQGPQFAARYFSTVCGRLGTRQAFSQAHRPQANGRAEVAGRVVKDLVRVVLQDKPYLTWVEVLPRVLRVYHDTVDPATNLSPYQVVFGRSRNTAGLPWEPEAPCEEATEFMDRMEEIDRCLADRQNEIHTRIAEYRNTRRKYRPIFCDSDWVWVINPKGVGGTGLHPRWHGPYKVAARTGLYSYKLRTEDRKLLEVHASQMAICCHQPLGDPPLRLQVPPPPDFDPEDLPESWGRGRDEGGSEGADDHGDNSPEE
jgi:hypothetical protein